jgi:hypothetical protein
MVEAAVSAVLDIFLDASQLLEHVKQKQRKAETTF